MRRKLTAALLTAAMAISLTACGGSGDTAWQGHPQERQQV